MGPGRERGRGGKGNRDGVGTETGTEVETCREKQDGNGDRSGDRNESSSGDGSGDGNEDGNKEGEGEANKRKKPHMTCRRDQRHFHSPRIIICEDKERNLRVPDSSVRKARCLYKHIAPRG